LVGVVGGGGCDPQDDAVAMMNLEGKGSARGAVLDRYTKGLPVERMPRIDDGDGLD